VEIEIGGKGAKNAAIGGQNALLLQIPRRSSRSKPNPGGEVAVIASKAAALFWREFIDQ
jgi:hypothetical protein